MVQYASTTDSLTIEGVYWVDTIVTGTIYEGVANSITATLKDVDSDTVTTFDGDFTVTAQDDNGLIVQVSADGVTYTDSIDVTATSGAYTGDVYFDITDDIITPIAVRFQVATADAINEYQPYGVDSVERGTNMFEFITYPGSTKRSANMTVEVQVFDVEGLPITTASPNCTLTLTNGDTGDVLSKTSIASSEWTGGIWSYSTLQITGGTGLLGGMVITITDDTGTITSSSFEIATYSNAFSIATEASGGIRTGSDTIYGLLANWYVSQVNAYSALYGSTTTSAQVSPGVSVVANYSVQEDGYGGTDILSSATQTVNIGYYPVSESVRTVAINAVGIEIDFSTTGIDNHLVGNSSGYRDQGTATMYYGYAMPQSHADLLAGVPIISAPNYNTSGVVVIDPSVFANMPGTGDQPFYLWWMSSDWSVEGNTYVAPVSGDVSRYARSSGAVTQSITLLW